MALDFVVVFLVVVVPELDWGVLALLVVVVFGVLVALVLRTRIRAL